MGRRRNARGTRTGWKRWLKLHYLRLVRQDDEPERIAAGLALGVALGVLPTFGLGIIIAIVTAGLFKVNKVSAVIGTMVMNPWTATFFWAMSYITGSLVLGESLTETVKLIRELRTHADLWKNLLEQRLLLPYIIGNVLITLASSAFFYMAGLYVVRAHRKARRKKRLKEQA